jgi:hypothetical protein
MRATDIIRGVLDLIDQVECAAQAQEPTVAIAVTPDEEPIQTGVDTNRFKHIYAMLDAERSNPPMYDNSPNETVAGIDSVTKDAGGGWNGPKNPADMKADSISMYPNFQATGSN